MKTLIYQNFSSEPIFSYLSYSAKCKPCKKCNRSSSKNGGQETAVLQAVYYAALGFG